MTFETFFPEEAEKQRKEYQEFLKNNPPKKTNLGTFQPISMPTMRSMAPNLLANQIVGVQPMRTYSGKLFKWAMDGKELKKYRTNGKFKLKRLIKFYNEKHKWQYLKENPHNIKHITKPTKKMLWYCVATMGMKKTMKLYPHPILDLMNI